MPIVGLDHVQVATPPGCEPEARRFYGGLLGLVRVEKPAALRARGGAWFVLAAGQQLYVGVEDPFALARKAHPALRVAGGETEGPRRAAASVTRTRGARRATDRADCAVRWDDTRAGVARFYVEDPWGNRLELMAAEGGA